MKNNNYPNANIDSKNIKKTKIKVLIIVGDDRNSNNIYEYTDDDGNKLYGGFYWDIWTLIKEKTKDKYDYVITYTSNNHNDYSKYVKHTADGVYDIVIGPFFHSSNLERVISYTQPILMNANVIVHVKKDTTLSNISNLLWSNKYLLYYIVGFGLIAGVILFVFDKGRSRFLDQIKNAKNKQKATFIRSLQTGVSSMFGELGYLTENAKTKWGSFLLVIMISSCSFIALSYIQSIFTENLIKISNNSYYSTKNIPFNKCLGYKDSSEVKKLERYGVQVKYFNYNEITLNDLVQKYINNSNKYDGVITNYIDGQYIINKFPHLVMSTDFGYEPISFIINQKLHLFQEDINEVILKLRLDLTLDNICNKYYQKFKFFVCALS